MVSIGITIILLLAGGVAARFMRKINDLWPAVILTATALVAGISKATVPEDYPWVMHPTSWWSMMAAALITIAVIAIVLMDIELANYVDWTAALAITLVVGLPFGEHAWLAAGLWLLFFAWTLNPKQATDAIHVDTLQKLMASLGGLYLALGLGNLFLGWSGAFLALAALLFIIAFKIKGGSKLLLIVVIMAAVCASTFGFALEPWKSFNNPFSNGGVRYAQGDGATYPKQGVKLESRTIQPPDSNRVVPAQLIQPVSFNKTMSPTEAVEKLGYPFGQHEPAMTLEQFRKTYGNNAAIKACAARWLRAPHAGQSPVTLKSELEPTLVLVGPNPGDAMKVAAKAASDVGIDIPPGSINSAPYLLTFKQQGKTGCEPIIDTSNRVMIAWTYRAKGSPPLDRGFDAFTGAPWYIVDDKKIGSAITN